MSTRLRTKNPTWNEPILGLVHYSFILRLECNNIGKNNVLVVCVFQIKGSSVGGFSDDLKLVAFIVPFSWKLTERKIKIIWQNMPVRILAPAC